MFDEGVFKRITDHAFQSAVETAIREVIAKNTGYGLESSVKELIQSEARRIIETEPESREKIREQLRHWIAKAGSGDKERGRY